MTNEIKPSFSIKYIILVLLTTIITAVITFIIQNYQEKENTKRLALTVRGGTNELKLNKKNDDAIIVKYSLKNDTSEVKGYYRKTILLNNIGNVGLENIKCKIVSKDSNIVLLPTPKLESYPKEIGPIEFKINTLSPNQNDIYIPLLNKEEGLSISYEGYSKKAIQYLDLEVSIRQKNLEIEKIDNFILKEEHNIISTIAKYGKYIFGGFFSFSLVLSLVFYVNWKTSAELRNRHNGNFWAYWWRGY